MFKNHSDNTFSINFSKKLFWVFTLCFAVITSTTSCSALTGKKSVSKKQILDSEMGIIVSYINSGETRLALNRINSARKEHPNNSDLMNLMRLTQMALKNSLVAAKYFKMAYKKDPKAHSLLNLSSAYLTLKKYGLARKSLAKALSTDLEYDKKERIYHNIAFTYQKQKKYTQAIKFYKKALSVEPTYHKSWQELANNYEASKQRTKALHAYKKARDFCQNCFAPNLALAKAYLRRKNKTTALKTMKNFLKIESISAVDQKKARQSISSISRKKIRL